MLSVMTDMEIAAIAATRHPKAEEIAAYRAWLVGQFGTDTLRPDVEDRVYTKAWDEGHSNGYGEVTYYYGEFAEVALLAQG